MGFLTKKELKDLTGYSTNNKVIEVLLRQGIGFVTDVNGNIKTTWEAVNTVLIGNHAATMPNFDALGT